MDKRSTQRHRHCRHCARAWVWSSGRQSGEWREGRRSDEPRLTGATQPQQHNSNTATAGTTATTIIKTFTVLIKDKQRTLLLRCLLPRLGSILVSQFSLFYLPINEAIFLQVYPTHTHTPAHTRLNLYLQI